MASSAPQKDTNTSAATKDKPADDAATKKPAATLEEDDEFEDFPVEGVYPSSQPLLAPSPFHNG